MPGGGTKDIARGFNAFVKDYNLSGNNIANCETHDSTLPTALHFAFCGQFENLAGSDKHPVVCVGLRHSYSENKKYWYLAGTDWNYYCPSSDNAFLYAQTEPLPCPPASPPTTPRPPPPPPPSPSPSESKDGGRKHPWRPWIIAGAILLLLAVIMGHH